MFYVLGDTGTFGPYARNVARDVQRQLNNDRGGCDFVVLHEDFVAGNDKSDWPSPDVATCGTCGRSWDDAIVTSVTPAPAARCIWEYEHAEADR